MKSRSKLLATLVSLVAIAVLAATLGTYRITVLSGDLGELLEHGVPAERAADDLRRLASRRVGALEASRVDAAPEFDREIRSLSDAISKQLEMLESVCASSDAGAPLGGLPDAIGRVRSEEAAFRNGGTDASVTQASGRAVESAATHLAVLTRKITDHAAAQASADERTSLILLSGLAIASLVLGVLLTRTALRVFAEVQTLRILVPVCSGCLSVRNDPPFWRLIDRYLEDRQHTKLAHGRCPRCEAARDQRRETT